MNKKEAVLLMLDGKIVVDPDGDKCKYNFDEGKFKHQNKRGDCYNFDLDINSMEETCWKIYEETIVTYSCDLLTGKIIKLEWQDCPNCVENTYTLEEAIKYANSLGNGWRLPTIQELKSIVDYRRYKPAIIDKFKYVGSSYYWSSTDDASYTSNAWVVNFYSGSDTLYHKYKNNYVRCVREV